MIMVFVNMSLLRNRFTQCIAENHSSGGKVLACVNTMSERHRYFVYNSKISMCEYHMCVILVDRNDGTHDTVACSGAIMRFGNDLYYFNPLTPFGLYFDEMLPMTRSAIDYFAIQYQYYFQADVRSKFTEPIVNINCTNSMKTCLTFSSNRSLCFGNIEDTIIIHSTESLIHGIIISFTVGACCYLFWKKHAKNFIIPFLFLFYIVPLLGLGMIYNGWFLSMTIPYLMGNVIVIFIFNMLYYPLHDINEYINNNTVEMKKSRY